MCYVGGCCGFGPSHIHAASYRLYRDHGVSGATNLGQVRKLKRSRHGAAVAVKSRAMAF